MCKSMRKSFGAPTGQKIRVGDLTAMTNGYDGRALEAIPASTN